MRHFILLLSLMFSTASFAFESADSALDFVYEYAADTIGGIKLTDYRYSYTVGVMKHDIDTIFNYRGVYENNELVGSTADTFVVPQDHYAFFISLPEYFVFEGQSPYVRYLFLSKKDSSYIVIDTIGEPEHLTKWDTVRTDGRKSKKQAIEDLSQSIEFHVQNENPYFDMYLIENYDVYLIEDTTNFNAVDNAERLRYIYGDINKAWNFIIDKHEDTCLYIIYWRNMEGSVSQYSLPMTFYTQTDFSTIDGFTLVISKNANGVRDVKSDLDVTIYPNPASDAVHVSEEGCELSLFSNDGKLVKSVTGDVMPIKEFSPGVYFLKISKDGKCAVKEIIKE